jgi:hypothetical protein
MLTTPKLCRASPRVRAIEFLVGGVLLFAGVGATVLAVAVRALFVAAIAPVLVALGARALALTRAAVTVDDGGVSARNVFRTRRFEWSEISHLALREKLDRPGDIYCVPVLYDRRGGQMPLYGMACFRKERVRAEAVWRCADEMTRTAQRHAREARGRGRLASGGYSGGGC